MPNIWIIFITGLTTGGLSCLLVQGGLLANVIANQNDGETDLDTATRETATNHYSKRELINHYSNQHRRISQKEAVRGEITFSIILFLVAKIVAYTLLGAGLGWLGTMIQLTPTGRGILMLIIALFMVGTALRLLNIHPIFNYFQLQPPKSVRRLIRRWSKNGRTDIASPLFLGALTVLIPCGVTQAMMVLAIGTGNPLFGAVIMFAFTLGTTPIFFILAYFTTRLGEKLHGYFVRVVTIMLLIFALYSLESGLNLLGSPISYASYKQRLQESQDSLPTASQTLPDIDEPTSTVAVSKEQTLTIKALDDGYSPSVLKAKTDIPTKLVLVTNDSYSCARAFTIPSLGIQKILPETGREIIELPPQKKGRLRFSCSMGMYTGLILFE